MKSILFITALLTLAAPAFAGRCTGKRDCRSCSTCNYCKWCNTPGQKVFCGIRDGAGRRTIIGKAKRKV